MAMPALQINAKSLEHNYHDADAKKSMEKMSLSENHV
jgi:hypothetical protein